MKTILYYRRNNYGTEVVYIATQESAEQALIAQHVKRLTGRATLTASDMDALAGLGFAFIQVMPPQNHATQRSRFGVFAGGQ